MGGYSHLDTVDGFWFESLNLGVMESYDTTTGDLQMVKEAQQEI